MVVVVLGLIGCVAHAQIFVVDSGANVNLGSISTYGLDGSGLSTPLISGLNSPGSIVVSDRGTLLVSRSGDIQVGEYSAGGSILNSALLVPVNYPGLLALSENRSRLFVATNNFNGLDGKITEYTSNGGFVETLPIANIGRISALAMAGGRLFFANHGPLSVFVPGVGLQTDSLLPGFNVDSITIVGSDMYVAYENKIGHFLTSGATVNATLITLPHDGTSSLSIVGDDLYVLNSLYGTIGKYTTLGDTVDASLISGLGNQANGMVVAGVAIPEPGSSGLVAAIAGLALAGITKRRRLSAVMDGREDFE